MTCSPCWCWLCSGPVALGRSKKQFRVCADPENLPFSNRKLEGFENKIADLFAKELGASPTYVWWGQRQGFIRNTMNATLKEERCDVVIGVPEGYDLVRTTKPYYRSTYVFVYPKGKGLQIKSLDDPILKKIKDRRASAWRRLHKSPSRSRTGNAGNADVFARGIEERLGVAPEVVSGDEEAALSYDGATRALVDVPGPIAVLDIGGGSTELIVGDAHGHVRAARSLDVGSVRVTERLMPSDPPTADEISAARDVVDDGAGHPPVVRRPGR